MYYPNFYKTWLNIIQCYKRECYLGIITWCRSTEIPNPVSYILAGVYSSTDNFLSPIPVSDWLIF